MKTEVRYYSRSGNTKLLAEAIVMPKTRQVKLILKKQKNLQNRLQDRQVSAQKLHKNFSRCFKKKHLFFT